MKKLSLSVSLMLINNWVILDNFGIKYPVFAQEKTKEEFLLITQNNNDQLLELTEITVINNSIFTLEINEIVNKYDLKKITLSELEEIANNITSLYLNNGYLSTRAVLENITNESIAIIRVDEGEIEKINIEGSKRLENYIKTRIALGAKTPFNTGKLEDQLRLLKNDPLIENIEASLRAGTGEKQSILDVKVKEGNPFFATVGIDNYSPPSIGGTQMTFNVGYGNVFGFGDSFAVSYKPRWQDWSSTYNLDLSYSIPLNAMNGSLQTTVSFQENQVLQGDFEPLNIRGESQFYEINYRQPLLRNPREEFALSLGISYRSGQTFTFQGPTPFGIGPDDDGFTRTNVLSFGQDYLKRDATGAWGVRSQFRLGVGLLDVTTSVRQGDPDGYFLSWLGQLQRVQLLGENHLLIIQGDIQLSDRPLLPSEQFVIGGGQSVRGYRQNVRAGDNGFRFSIEDRIAIVRNKNLSPVFQIAPFFDMGSVWNNRDNPNFEAEDSFIAGLGLGVIWQPIEGLNLRLDYAPPLINLPDKGNNIQDDGFYFSLKYNF